MIKKFRHLGIVVIAAGAMLSANASSVGPVTFEDLALQAKKDGAPLQLTDQVPELAFTGAWVYHTDLTAMPPYCCASPHGHDGFIQSGVINTNLQSTISVSLLDVKGDIDVLRFDLASPNDVEIFAVSNTGDKTRFVRNTGSGFWDWADLTLDFTNLGVINSVEFVTDASRGRFFALDNLLFTLAPSGGGNVPEPAGLGLVALALAAAGLVTRRRQAR